MHLVYLSWISYHRYFPIQFCDTKRHTSRRTNAWPYILIHLYGTASFIFSHLLRFRKHLCIGKSHFLSIKKNHPEFPLLFPCCFIIFFIIFFASRFLMKTICFLYCIRCLKYCLFMKIIQKTAKERCKKTTLSLFSSVPL